MAAKTKADVVRELTALQLEHARFKNRVTDVTKQMMEKHGVSLCNDGLREWAEELGVKPPIDQETYEIHLTVHVTCTDDDIDDLAEKFSDLVDSNARETLGDKGEFDWTEVGYNRE